MHLKPLVVPLQEPVRYCAEEQLTKLHVVQVPLAREDEPWRNWLALQVGCALHLKPLVVPPQDPVWYSSKLLLQVAKLQVAQAPFVVVDAPRRY